MQRGHFGIGIIGSKFPANLGTLWRSAYCLGADYIFTIGKRYKGDCTDTTRAPGQIPLWHFETYEDFKSSMPVKSILIGVDNTEFYENGKLIRPRKLEKFTHPVSAIYLLGAEDHGIPENVLQDIRHCGRLVAFDSKHCVNVAVAGSIVMYDRNLKNEN